MYALQKAINDKEENTGPSTPTEPATGSTSGDLASISEVKFISRFVLNIFNVFIMNCDCENYIFISIEQRVINVSVYYLAYKWHWSD